MSLVQLGINSTCHLWKFAKLDSLRRLVQFWQNFQTSLVLLIPNYTRHRMITYTYLGGLISIKCSMFKMFYGDVGD